jgi:hypothetical protein
MDFHRLTGCKRVLAMRWTGHRSGAPDGAPDLIGKKNAKTICTKPQKRRNKGYVLDLAGACCWPRRAGAAASETAAAAPVRGFFAAASSLARARLTVTGLASLATGGFVFDRAGLAAPAFLPPVDTSSAWISRSACCQCASCWPWRRPWLSHI